jgi:hypothetical protein
VHKHFTSFFYVASKEARAVSPPVKRLRRSRKLSTKLSSPRKHKKKKSSTDTTNFLSASSTALLPSTANGATGKHIILDVMVPTLIHSINTKRKFLKTTTLQEVVEKVQNVIPDEMRGAEYHIYHNGLRLVGSDRSLESHGLKSGGTFNLFPFITHLTFE